MSDNPYRFTVEVSFGVFSGKWLVWLLIEGTLGRATEAMCLGDSFTTEAEANEHAELIRRAMREVS
jgi:hypothetical protein